MWDHIYVSEKLRELEEERARRKAGRPAPKRGPVLLGPAARRTGRALRWLGEGLEAWGTARPARQSNTATFE
ncbi:MAG: hypothetical protein V3S20_00485 [Dehalococcoidia bacterium]